MDDENEEYQLTLYGVLTSVLKENKAREIADKIFLYASKCSKGGVPAIVFEKVEGTFVSLDKR